MDNKKIRLWDQTLLPLFSLFTSMGTLFCCALPALLVTLGMGAALTGLIGQAPWLVPLFEHKGVIFIVAGVLICLSAGLQWRARFAPCPADKRQAQLCGRLRKWSWGILIVAAIVYLIGFFFAFIASYIFH